MLLQPPLGIYCHSHVSQKSQDLVCHAHSPYSVPPCCSLRQLEVRGLWHFLVWHIMKCNNDHGLALCICLHHGSCFVHTNRFVNYRVLACFSGTPFALTDLPITWTIDEVNPCAKVYSYFNKDYEQPSKISGAVLPDQSAEMQICAPGAYSFRSNFGPYPADACGDKMVRKSRGH